MKSNRQKSLRKKSIIFGILSWGILFVLTTVYMILGFRDFNAVKDGVQIFTDEARAIFVSMSVTAIIGTIMTFFLKEGMRTFVWIVCVILGSIILGAPGMYIALGCWLVDDYVIHKLFLYYKNKLSIRKEIDMDLGENINGDKQE